MVRRQAVAAVRCEQSCRGCRDSYTGRIQICLRQRSYRFGLDAYADTDPNSHTDAFSYAHSNSDTNSHSHTYSYTHAHTNCDAYPYADTDSHPHANPFS